MKKMYSFQKKTIGLIFIGLTSFIFSSFQGSPPNDNLCNPINIPEFTTVIGDYTNASVEDDEITPSCFLVDVQRSLWFSYVSPSASDTDIIVTSLDNSDTPQVAIYEAPEDCTDFDSLVEVACSVGVGPDGTTIIYASNFTMEETYYIQVDYGGSSNDGTFEIYLESNFSTQGFDDLQISLYPNPSSDILYIEAPDNIDEILIYNLLGQEVYKKKHNQNEVAIPTTNLDSAKYFVKLQIGGKTYVEGFIKY